MTSSSPSPETVRFIATIIAARRTPLAEVPELIRHLDTVLTRLVHARTERLELPGRASAALPEPSAKRTKLRAPQRPVPTTTDPVRTSPVGDMIAAQPVPAKRGRKPGKASAPRLRAGAEAAFGTVRRQPKQVVVEVKRDGGRRTSARAEAEHVLGGVGRSKTTRRVTS